MQQQIAYSAKYCKSRTNGGSAGYVLLFYLPGNFVNPARALRALGLLLADGAPTVGRKKTF